MFRIFDKLGGENSSLEVIAAARGKRPSADLVGKWKRERRIPPIAAVVLMRECKRRGIIADYDDDCISPNDFLPPPTQIREIEAAE